ncbi:MAG: hypothetical protein AB7N24_14260 [Dehalococcoidia bacterium]
MSDLNATICTVPTWPDWVSASATRNWCLKNTLQDWLALYGESAGFESDPEPLVGADFRSFIFEKGRQFEARVVELLSQRTEVFRPHDLAEPSRSIEARDATVDAMRRGASVIAQGVLWESESQTYGTPDLLIRSDVLESLFPDAIRKEEVLIGAPALGLDAYHYRVVDIKFTTLQLDRNGHAARGHMPYLVQVSIYNNALGKTQGFLPPRSYLLGRSWSGAGNTEGRGCFDRLAPIPTNLSWDDGTLTEFVTSATSWVRRVRAEGATWHPSDGPRVPELRPNPAEADYPWRSATRLIAEQNRDPILAWQVGCAARDLATGRGVSDWTDPRFNARIAGLDGSRAARLDLILDHNRAADGPVVIPERIQSEREQWIQPAEVEFYVDFETVSDVNDDFVGLPARGGQAMIFMIGCGHLEGGEWTYSCFTVDRLDPQSEVEVIEAWLEHMRVVQDRLAPNLAKPLVFHWSPAESSGLSTGLKSARARHPERSRHWEEPNWYDFLSRVVRAEPVVVRGPMGFGLKAFAGSLRRHGLIQSEWPDNVSDGLGAMVCAWTAYAESGRCGRRVSEHELMKSVQQYNEVDCRVMMEAIRYLRRCH